MHCRDGRNSDEMVGGWNENEFLLIVSFLRCHASLLPIKTPRHKQR